MLFDGHSILGIIIAKLFYKFRSVPEEFVPSIIAKNLHPAVRSALRRTRFSNDATFDRYLTVGMVLANLPDVDVLYALYLRSYSKGHERSNTRIDLPVYSRIVGSSSSFETVENVKSSKFVVFLALLV